MNSHRRFPKLTGPPSALLDWLLKAQCVPLKALTRPTSLQYAKGFSVADGYFDQDERGYGHLVFECHDPPDLIFWDYRNGKISTDENRAFALGEEFVHDPATCAFDCALTLYPDPLSLLRAGRLFGAVVFRWELAFERLRDCPRIRLADPLLVPLYRKWMRPPHMPEISVEAVDAA